MSLYLLDNGSLGTSIQKIKELVATKKRLERQRDAALEQLAAMTDQRDAALMTIRLAQRTAGED
jgi:hypothetical protein